MKRAYHYFSKFLILFLSFFMSFIHPMALLAFSAAGTELTDPTLVQTMISGIPDSFTFTKDLGLGAQNDEVKMLQIILNTDSRTRVNDTGLGSPGNETNYFGYATLGAVRNFQEIYGSIILEPIGYNNPTGIVGSRTRSVLNQILDNLKNNRPADLNISIGTSVFTPPNTANDTSTVTTNTLQTVTQNVNIGPTTPVVQQTAPVQAIPQNTNTTAPALTAAQVNTNFGTMNKTSGQSSNSNSGGGSNTTALVAAGAIVGGAIAVSALSSTASGGIRTVFGGNIVYVQYCTCEASILLFIFDKDLKSVIQLLYIPGVSTLKSAYNVFTAGPQVLGGYYQSPIPCLVYSGEACVSWGTPIGVIDTLRGVGTTPK